MATAGTVPASQTLSRGIRILEVLADAREPLSIDEISRRLGVHRSVAYRLVRTLEDHGLVVRTPAGHLQLGARLAALAAAVAHDLNAEALPELTGAANELGMTCFVAVLDHDECVTLASVEPRHAVNTWRSTRVAASGHPRRPGKAILSLLPDDARPAVSAELADEIRDAATRGYATSHDEVVPTLRAVAVPLELRGRAPSAIAAVFVASTRTDAEIAARLTRSADAIRLALGG